MQSWGLSRQTCWVGHLTLLQGFSHWQFEFRGQPCSSVSTPNGHTVDRSWHDIAHCLLAEIEIRYKISFLGSRSFILNKTANYVHQKKPLMVLSIGILIFKDDWLEQGLMPTRVLGFLVPYTSTPVTVSAHQQTPKLSHWVDWYKPENRDFIFQNCIIKRFHFIDFKKVWLSLSIALQPVDVYTEFSIPKRRFYK